jgi:flagellar hook assembly protein FlgD
VLNPPYPNPFNPETTIQLYTSTSQKTSLIIYNIQGHQIKTLYTEFLPAGTHTFRWDGTQDNGKEVASGIYIIYAKNNRQTVRQKAVIIR